MGNTPVRLLVVDDDEDDFVLVRDLLQETPGTRFSVEWAASPGEGARRLRERAHDAYLIDYRLGATSGIELMRAAIAAGVTAPIVLLTGRGDHEVDHEAMHAGAADYLVKGKFDGHQLSRVLRYAIERARDRMALELGEARYRRLFESVPAPMWVYQRDTLRFLAVNDAAIEHYGYSRDAFLAMSAADIRPAEDVSEFREFSQGLDAGMTHSGYWRHQRKDGSLIDVEISSHDIEWNGQRARMVLAKDVTEQLRAQEEIRARAAQLRQVLSDASDALIVVGADATVRFANPAVREVLGRDPDAMLGTIFDLPGLTRGEREIEVARVADEVRIAEARVSETEWEGEHARIYALRDVTDRRRAEDRTRLLERAIESTSNGVVIADARRPDLPLIYVNRAFERMTGYSAEEALGKNCRFLQGPDTSQPELGQIRAALREQRDCEVVLRNYTRQGGLLWNQLSIAPVRDSHGEVTHYIGVLNDVTERRRYEAELSYLASHDPVTGLSRYVVLQEQVEALIGARDESGKLALLYVDIDRFHTVNETMGHVIGDQALRVFAERLRESVGDPDRVCRLASDEFLALVPFDGDAGEPAAVAHCIRAALETPIEIGPYRLYLTCSIGISVYPDNGASATDLLHAAEAAMARAKRQGRDSVCSFSNEQATDLRDRLNLGGRLREAILAGEMVLHYQPQVSALSGEIVGLEALVRWQTGDLGLLPPARFIRVAEELGLIVELGRWVLDDACRQIRTWLDAGVPAVTVAVNVSALQLQRPAFVDEVRAVLETWRLPAEMLEIELTESAIMDNVPRMIQTMVALKQLGVRLALDDFGTGFSSLNYLKRFPLDKLKIDQSFVREITHSPGDAGIVRAVIAMGHQLHMKVMAEGVETEAQLGYLRRNHCDQLQGLFLSAPLPAPEAELLLQRRHLGLGASAATGPTQSLLLLDDDQNILNALTRLLRRDGYQIFAANNMVAAFDVLGRHHVKVIVSDQRMPDGTGTDFLSRVKEMYPDTVRLVLSGYTDLESVTAAINRGAIYRFITKPWDDNDLRGQIQEAFRTYEAQLEARAVDRKVS